MIVFTFLFFGVKGLGQLGECGGLRALEAVGTNPGDFRILTDRDSLRKSSSEVLEKISMGLCCEDRGYHPLEAEHRGMESSKCHTSPEQ